MKKKHNLWRLRLRSLWRVWCYALGEKQGKCNREADIIAIIRTVILMSYMITNVAIVANAVRHWNDVEYSRNEVKND